MSRLTFALSLALMTTLASAQAARAEDSHSCTR